MFSDKFGLTKAVLEGKKTMTRRIIKAPKKMDGKEVYGFAVVRRSGSNEVIEVFATDADGAQINNILPAFKVGEVVAVAQSYEDASLNWINMLKYKGEPGWKNKMFVRADLMPHQIRITNVRVERLQDISDEDCLREGIYSHTVELDEIPGVHPRTDYSYQAKIGSNIPRWWFPTPKQAYAALIDKVSGKGVWESNPFVFVYEFELVK